MKTRKARAEDADACLEIAKLDKATHWTAEDFVLAAKDRDAIFLVAEERGKVLGYS